MINANYGCGKSVSREVERNQRRTARRGPFLIASSRQSKHSRRAVAPNIPAPTPHAAAVERRSGRGPKHRLRDSIDSIRQSTHNEDRATPRLLHASAVAGATRTTVCAAAVCRASKNPIAPASKSFFTLSPPNEPPARNNAKASNRLRQDPLEVLVLPNVQPDVVWLHARAADPAHPSRSPA